MERLATALDDFIRFKLRNDDWLAFVVFVIASGVIGVAIVLLDYCSTALGRPSALKLSHGRRTTPTAMVLWMTGSMLAASLGSLARVFEPTPLAAVLTSLTWRTMLAQLQRISTHAARARGEE